MQVSLITSFFFVAFFLLPLFVSEPVTPLVPNTAVATADATTITDESAAATTSVPNESVQIAAPAKTKTNVPSKPSTPLRVRIPAIGLNSPIEHMGITSNGDLDVPDGSTKNVGWYSAGTKPGEVGSAVFDAHVFAAFKKLRYALPGTDVYVDMSNGETLHFKIKESTVYELAEVPVDRLFNRTDERRLNLITCAGKLTADKSTYDHRLIAYAVLVK